MKIVVRAFHTAVRYADASVLCPIMYATPGAYPAKEFFIHSLTPVFTLFQVFIESE